MQEAYIEISLQEHYRRRVLEKARLGSLGLLETKNQELSAVYQRLSSLLDSPSSMLILSGLSGSGKFRMAREFVNIENTYRKLGTHPPIQLKRIHAQDIESSLLIPEQASSNKAFYIHSLEQVSVEALKKLKQSILTLQDRQYLYAYGNRIFLDLSFADFLYLNDPQKGQLFAEIFKLSICEKLRLPSLKQREEDSLYILKLMFSELQVSWGIELNLFAQSIFHMPALSDLSSLKDLLILLKDHFGADLSRWPHDAQLLEKFLVAYFPQFEAKRNVLSFSRAT